MITRQSAKKVSMQWQYNLADSWGWGVGVFSSHTFASLCMITRQRAKEVGPQWQFNLADSWG